MTVRELEALLDEVGEQPVKLMLRETVGARRDREDEVAVRALGGRLAGWARQAYPEVA